MSNSPAFQFYPADLISDPEVMFWDMESVGCYWQMITYLWLNSGKAEIKPEFFRKLFRVKRAKKAELMWIKISKKFDCIDGVVTHKRVLEEMEKQAATRLARQCAGKKGGEQKQKNLANAKNLPLAKSTSSSSSSTSSSNIYSATCDSFILSNMLFMGIRHRKPDYKQPNLQVWSKDIDKMLRLDKRTFGKIEAVIKWCQFDEFWQNNILSTKKLRQHFDKLELQMSKPAISKTQTSCVGCGATDGLKYSMEAGEKVYRCPKCRATKNSKPLPVELNMKSVPEPKYLNVGVEVKKQTEALGR